MYSSPLPSRFAVASRDKLFSTKAKKGEKSFYITDNQFGIDFFSLFASAEREKA